MDLIWNGAAVAGKMSGYQKDVTYTDPASGEADSVDVSIFGEKWIGPWFPVKGDTLEAKIKVYDWEREGDDRTLPCGSFVLDTLRERGKVRPIDAPHINDRQIHKTLCNNVLIPLYGPSMIYANGASQRGKGLHFHYKLLEDQLREQFRKNGREGAVFLMDFHHFFPSAPHALIYQRHRDLILNEQIRAIADTVVASVPGGVGMPLGVEPSQQEMVALPSSLDNWLKCQKSIHGAGHYMDDYATVLDSPAQAEEIMEETIRRAEAMGLQVNRNKCHIVPLDKPFRFCKCKFYLTETGRVITHGARDGMKAARRKIRLYKKRVDAGEMTVPQAEDQLQGHIAYYENFDDHGRVMHLRRIIHATFKGGENHV